MSHARANRLVDTQDLITIGDFIRWASSRFREAELHFGHGTGNAVDEACWLIAAALHLDLPLTPDLHPCRLTPSERAEVIVLLERRVNERIPAAYLTGRAWFAGLEFKVDASVMIPRSPIAELIENQFEPWLNPEHISSLLDLCAGSGCIGLAAAVHQPGLRVDLAERSPAALRVAADNLQRLAAEVALEDRVRLFASDLFAALGDSRYDLILSNPPYVGRAELAELPPEYAHEPTAAFAAGEQGLDLVLRILHEAPDHLTEQGALIVEVGNTESVLQACLPQVPFLWLAFEHGGTGVFLLHREQLIDYHAAFAQALATL
ncbi:50S ribosomal protein L3 N(5)-glutamine methyltransferase [Rhabdochromatium marinum]|uniref:50S ribosomal protein L3 N(5)-glutamine methyltransferase n=1 Tax=Rhabdochromatium marinum TaxID=48729 RepID=UPI001907050D|nr:50S ribosomal protein L3 N(5)-glutamine methyltransferase [Rhabdochromatium marinum]MBK1648750.1 50S ribosomal protein L3 N(5)-glutamine methyltransferase [Rhabdochromatium marinum]